MDINFKLEKDKTYLITKDGSVVGFTDFQLNCIQVAIDHFIEHCGDLIQGGNLDEETMKEVEKESFFAQDFKELIA
ncbi:MAG: hypothetical protein ACPGPR_05360 [Paracoccaceae bacterium]